ncbi:cation channel sperm-associated protein subunit beta-like [Lingula anatina]|uniref:Cation channel sperm-associated protein subunit beta-like n=1 Tax=Lingula anatina TaxID=7574 RepID=A0A1S3HL59_LINAN|nr:cation channel sperm-associated protein subunit beta-like [Lingula anatina]|eukprot:XP_013386196.1 cation channel sperm-associated protein subunit beta-like [Lingula anatina]
MSAISALTERMGSYTVTTYLLNSSLAFDAGHCFPPFTFPETFQVKSLTFDPITGVLYVLGNQVWVSYNGISHFQHVLTLGGQHGQVDSVQFSHNTGSLLMKTTTGTILYGKTGISRLAVVHEATQSEQSNITTIQASHVGTMYRVWVDSSTLELHRQKIDVQQKMMSLDWSFSRPLAIQYLSDSEVVIFEHVAEGEIPTQAVPRFSDSNVGQAFSLKKGGSGIIHHVIYPAEPWSGFVSRVLLRVREPFHHESMGESPAQAFNLGIVPVNTNGSEVMLTLTGGLENSTGWVTSDIGKTAIVVGHPNVLILDVVNDTVATGHPVLAVREEVQVLTRAWYMMNLGNSSSESAWYVKEDRCRHALMTDTKLNSRSVVALDLGDNFTVKAEVEFITSVGQEEQYGSLLEVTSSNAILFATHTQSLVKGSGLSVLLENEEFRKGVTTLTFYIPTASLLCEKTSYTVTAQACCPGNKFLVFHYPTFISDEDYLTGDPQDAKGIKLLSDLPPNYRPPSQLGIAIPLTANMYHADPSKPREKNTYQISKQSGKYKQCAGKTTRDECGCTRAMKLSNLVKFSDCKERVYSLHHPAHLDLNFSIVQEGKPERLLREPYIYRVYELNDRVDYSVSTTMTPMLTHIRHYDKIKNSTIWYAAEGTELILTGTGLYHMRVSLIHGMSFCDLEAELQVYVIGSPIPYPVMYMINLGGGTVLLGILFLVYLVYLHGHHTFRERKLGPLCKELHDPIFREERRNLHD